MLPWNTPPSDTITCPSRAGECVREAERQPAQVSGQVGRRAWIWAFPAMLWRWLVPSLPAQSRTAGQSRAAPEVVGQQIQLNWWKSMLAAKDMLCRALHFAVCTSDDDGHVLCLDAAEGLCSDRRCIHFLQVSYPHYYI
jgi:hypothetical protein